MNPTRLKIQLVRHEGLKLKPYKDTVGKVTIGVGRNLDDVGITSEEAMLLLENDIAKCAKGLRDNLPWFEQLDEVRQRVLLDMAFNLGINGLLKFKKTLGFVQAGEYGLAATEMLHSQWAEQVGIRSSTLSYMMRVGKDPF